MLTVKGIERAKPRGKTRILLGDGKGLYLQITPTGGKSWILRYRMNGKRPDMGLGPYPEISLAAARDAATEARKLIRAGVDPVAARRAALAAAKADAATSKPFDEVATLYIDAKAAGWRDPTNRQKWANTLRDYASPVFGRLPVSAIDTGHVTAALQPIWQTKTETASRVRQRIEKILDFAKTNGWRQGENPARWAGHLENIFAKPTDVRRRKPMKSLPYAQLPAFMAALRERNDPGARALELTILSASRTDETLGAPWREFDFDAKVWTRPEERMKAGFEHRVPLNDALLAALPERGAPGDLVFPGLADDAMRKVLERMGVDAHVHGFRATFRTWAAECTNFPREVVEMVLAHKTENATEAAYQRSDHFGKRRLLMQQWARFCLMPLSVTAGKMVMLQP
jgi:integrase